MQGAGSTTNKFLAGTVARGATNNEVNKLSLNEEFFFFSRQVQVQDALICSYAAGHISDKAFLVLYEEYDSVNLCFPYWEYDSFQLNDLGSSECKAEFRMEKEDIPRLAAALQIPATFRCSQGTICPGEKGCVCYCGGLLTHVVTVILSIVSPDQYPNSV